MCMRERAGERRGTEVLDHGVFQKGYKERLRKGYKVELALSLTLVDLYNS